MRRDEQILEAAADLFLQHGYQKVTLGDIGSELGITGPAIYRHFSSKDELLASLFDKAMDHLLVLVKANDGGDPAKTLDSLVRAQVEFALTDRRMVSIYARESQWLSDVWRRHYNRRQREHIMRWVHALQGVYPNRSEGELHSTAHACIGLTLSIAQWPKDALATNDLHSLMYELICGALSALAD